MKINIKATNLDLTPAIHEYIEEKIGSLDRFLKRFEVKSEIEVFIEIARATKHHRHGNVLYAEATASLGKKILRAEHFDWDIRVAIDKVRDKLQQEIKKYKEKKIEKRKEIDKSREK
ncbi:MAG: ribosome-associated translation inhibitor RaiA [Patescibacteria group bacterium]